MVATLLADYGKRVLLLEKEVFPRYHIGESLLSGTSDLMKKIGVFDKVERDGYTKKWGVEWLWGSSGKSWTVYFKDALAMPNDYGYQVERAEFDHLLLTNAAEHGVEVVQQATVIDPLCDANGRIVGVSFRNADGSMTRSNARYIIDASGQGGFLSKKFNQITWDEKLRNMAIWSYWKGARKQPGLDEGNTFLPAFQDGWWWFIPLRGDRTSIGAVIDRDKLDEAKEVGFQEYYRRAIARTPALAARLEGATQIDEVRFLRDWSYRYDRFYGDGFLAVGDAACFIDPLFSTGVHLAMLAGYVAAVTVNTILDGVTGATEHELQQFYQRQYEAEYLRLKDQVYFLYSGHESDETTYFWKARSQFGVMNLEPKRAFVSLIAGAFEHRSWYSRYLNQLEVPGHLREIFEGRFSGQYARDDVIKPDRPIAQSTDWNVVDDFAIDGRHLRRGKTIMFSDGRQVAYDEVTREIIDLADGSRRFGQIVTDLGRRVSSPEAKLRAQLEKAITYGIVTCV